MNQSFKRQHELVQGYLTHRPIKATGMVSNSEARLYTESTELFNWNSNGIGKHLKRHQN